MIDSIGPVYLTLQDIKYIVFLRWPGNGRTTIHLQIGLSCIELVTTALFKEAYNALVLSCLKPFHFFCVYNFPNTILMMFLLIKSI